MRRYPALPAGPKWVKNARIVALRQLGTWLTLGACLVVSWVFPGWMVELLTIELTGHLGDALHWQEPVFIAVVGGVGLWLQGGASAGWSPGCSGAGSLDHVARTR
jgi:hypothetical protein